MTMEDYADEFWLPADRYASDFLPDPESILLGIRHAGCPPAWR
jgi:hypothetical protein